MTSVIDVLEELESNGSRLVKTEILERERERGNGLLMRILEASLNPYVNYGIAKFKMPKADTSAIVTEFGAEDEHDERTMLAFLDGLLPKLASRGLTGNAARDAVVDAFSEMNKRQQKWCKRILL